MMHYLVDILAWIGGFSIVAFFLGSAGYAADEKEVSRTRKILEYQLLIFNNQKTIMAQFEDISAALDKVDAAIAALPASTGGLTSDQASTILSRIDGQAAKLEAIATPPAPAPTA